MKNLKNKKRKTLAIIFIIILLIGIGLIVYNRISNTPYRPIKYVETIKYNENNIIYDDVSKYDGKIIKNYEDYQTFTKSYNVETNINPEDFNENYYIIVFAENDYCGGKINGIRSVLINNNKIEIDIGYDGSCGPCPNEYKLYIIPVKKEKINDSSTLVSYKYTVENKYNCNPNVAYKPLIYLYPKEKISVTVKLLKPENLTTTYPKYKDKWLVTAYPNGDLVDNTTNRKLYGLYWEGINNYSKIEKEGFIVKGEDTISFLETTLTKLGLNEREANEFIIYWLPKLEINKYNYIHFASEETINDIMPLDINPNPDTTIRILMEYKSLNKPIKIKKQQIKTPLRKGFTLVEWGGTEITK